MKNKYFFFTLISFPVAISLMFSGCIKKATDQDTSVEIKVQAEKTMEPQRKLRHVVLFKFKEGTTQEDINSVEMSFAALPAKIPEIRSFEWGTNNSPEGLDKGFTHCFILTFNSEEDRALYLPHPDHKAFGESIGEFIEDVLVVDYWN